MLFKQESKNTWIMQKKLIELINEQGQVEYNTELMEDLDRLIKLKKYNENNLKTTYDFVCMCNMLGIKVGFEVRAVNGTLEIMLVQCNRSIVIPKEMNFILVDQLGQYEPNITIDLRNIDIRNKWYACEWFSKSFNWKFKYPYDDFEKWIFNIKSLMLLECVMLEDKERLCSAYILLANHYKELGTYEQHKEYLKSLRESCWMMYKRYHGDNSISKQYSYKNMRKYIENAVDNVQRLSVT
jgi:hypothetical protein